MVKVFTMTHRTGRASMMIPISHARKLDLAEILWLAQWQRKVYPQSRVYPPSFFLGLNIHVQRSPSGQPEFHTQVSSLTLTIPTAWGSWATGQVPLEKGKLGDDEKPIS